MGSHWGHEWPCQGEFCPLPQPSVAVPSRGLLALPQRISIQRDKNKTISRKIELHFFQFLLARIEEHLGESQEHEYVLIHSNDATVPEPSWASHDFIDSPPAVMLPLLRLGRGARHEHGAHRACMRQPTHSRLQPKLYLSYGSAGASSATDRTARQSDFQPTTYLLLKYLFILASWLNRNSVR